MLLNPVRVGPGSTPSSLFHRWASKSSAPAGHATQRATDPHRQAGFKAPRAKIGRHTPEPLWIFSVTADAGHAQIEPTPQRLKHLALRSDCS